MVQYELVIKALTPEEALRHLSDKLDLPEQTEATTRTGIGSIIVTFTVDRTYVLDLNVWYTSDIPHELPFRPGTLLHWSQREVLDITDKNAKKALTV